MYCRFVKGSTWDPMLPVFLHKVSNKPGLVFRGGAYKSEALKRLHTIKGLWVSLDGKQSSEGGPQERPPRAWIDSHWHSEPHSQPYTALWLESWDASWLMLKVLYIRFRRTESSYKCMIITYSLSDSDRMSIMLICVCAQITKHMRAEMQKMIYCDFWEATNRLSRAAVSNSISRWPALVIRNTLSAMA